MEEELQTPMEEKEEITPDFTAEEIAEEKEPELPAEEETPVPNAEEEKEALLAAFPTLDAEALLQNERYGRLRALGLSQKEAALAVSGQIPAPPAGGKQHLVSVAKNAFVPAPVSMSEGERRVARELFGDKLSDEALDALYQKIR